MLEPKEKVITVTSKQKYDGTSSAACPFCMCDNAVDTCIHFVKKWETKYKSSITGNKIASDKYIFKGT